MAAGAVPAAGTLADDEARGPSCKRALAGTEASAMSSPYHQRCSRCCEAPDDAPCSMPRPASSPNLARINPGPLSPWQHVWKQAVRRHGSRGAAGLGRERRSAHDGAAKACWRQPATYAKRWVSPACLQPVAKRTCAGEARCSGSPRSGGALNGCLHHAARGVRGVPWGHAECA